MRRINIRSTVTRSPLKHILISAFLPLTAALSFGQELRVILDDDSSQTKEEYIKYTMEFIRSIEFDHVLDFGSGNMEVILKLANALPGKKFVFDDIDSSICNWTQLEAQIKKYELLEVNTKLVSIHICTEKSPQLEGREFNLILVSGLLHELNKKAEFLEVLQSHLGENGSILVSDAFYDNIPSHHNGCNNRFMTKTEFEEFLKPLDLTLIRQWNQTGIQDGKGRSYEWSILEFERN